jgi:hypothetical protein
MTLTINTLNGDYLTRDFIIFGEYDEKKYLGGIRNFTCHLELLKKLVDCNFAAIDECQNYSPSIKDFLDVAENMTSDVLFECYAVSPERDDYRITVEGVSVIIKDSNYKDLTLFIESFHDSDEFSIEHIDSEYHLRAWWD